MKINFSAVFLIFFALVFTSCGAAKKLSKKTSSPKNGSEEELSLGADWVAKLDKPKVAPVYGQDLPIPVGRKILNSVALLKSYEGTLYFGYLAQKDGAGTLAKMFRILALENNVWTTKVETEIAWAQGAYDFFVRNGNIYWTVFDHGAKSKWQIWQRNSLNGLVEKVGSSSPELDQIDSLESGNIEMDQTGGIYYGFYETANPWKFRLFQLSAIGWRDILASSGFEIGLSSWLEGSQFSNQGLVIDGSRIYAVGRDGRQKHAPLIIEWNPFTTAWAKVFSRESLGNKGELDFFSLDSRNGFQLFSAFTRGIGNGQIGGFYSRNSNITPNWTTEIEEIVDKNIGYMRPQRVFTLGNGVNSFLTTMTIQGQDQNFIFVYKGKTTKVSNRLTQGAPIGGSFSSVLHKKSFLVFHINTQSGKYQISELGVLP